MVGSRGLLLLDVDGPLNPYAAKPNARPDGYSTFRLTADGGWYTGSDARRHKGLRVWLHPGHGALLSAVAAETDLELVWATTWGADANRCIGPAIGLPDLPVITFPANDLDPTRGWLDTGSWKWPSVAEHADGRPLAWLDDDLDDPRFAAARIVFDRARADTPTLLATVEARRGLRSADLDTVRAWAADLPDATSGT